MTLINRTALFYSSSSKSAEDTFLCLNGLLIFDSGEAEISYLFRCQERYLMYGMLLKKRCLFFVKDERHYLRYLTKLEEIKAELKRIKRYYPFLETINILTPFFIQLDIYTLSIKKIFNPEEVKSKFRILSNQVSPLYGTILLDIKKLMDRENKALLLDANSLDFMTSKVMQLNDKAEQVRLLENNEMNIPLHLATSIATPEQLLNINSWSQFIEFIDKDKFKTTSFYIKSSIDSGGNGATKLNEQSFDEKYPIFQEVIKSHIISKEINMEELTHEVCTVLEDSATLQKFSEEELQFYVTDWKERRSKLNIKLLIQPEIKQNIPTDLFFGIGISCYIESVQDIKILVIAGQLYSDKGRTIHLGAYINEAFEANIMTEELKVKVINLCRIYAEKGYRGPISFDACLNEEQKYTLIYDCNPRLTAVFPPISVKRFLESEEIVVSSVINIDYRGRFIYTNLAQQLEILNQKNLLFTKEKNQGILVLPNLARDNGFDLLFINQSLKEVNTILKSGILGKGDDVDKGALVELYH